MTTNSSFYGDTPNYATSYPAQNDTNTNPVSGNTQAPSSFYPAGQNYLDLDPEAAAAFATTAAASAAAAASSAASAATSASGAATSASTAASAASAAATTAVNAAAGTATPLVNGTATVGSSTKWAHEDHVHPTDTSRAPVASPTFTGSITGTAKGHLFGSALGTGATGPVTISDANILLYNVGSNNWAGIGTDGSGNMWFKTGISGTPAPAFWIDNTQLCHFPNSPVAPTPTAGDNSTKLATTAFVLANAPTLSSGTPIDSSTAVLTTYTTVTNTAIIPLDDTIPQSTEGTLLLSATITPKSTTNKLRCRFSCTAVPAVGDNPTFAIISSTDVNAKQARYYSTAAGFAQNILLECEFVPGITTPVTVSIRCSPTGGNMYINGSGAGRFFGGANAAVLIVEEIKQ